MVLYTLQNLMNEIKFILVFADDFNIKYYKSYMCSRDIIVLIIGLFINLNETILLTLCYKNITKFYKSS